MKINRAMAAMVAAMLVFGAWSGYAREFKGVTFSDTETIGNAQTKLVGIGLRKKLVINVYLGALYLETPSNDAATVISLRTDEAVVLHFIYNKVGADDLVKAWTEGFEKNAPGKAAALKSQIATFNGYFTEGMKPGRPSWSPTHPEPAPRSR